MKRKFTKTMLFFLCLFLAAAANSQVQREWLTTVNGSKNFDEDFSIVRVDDQGYIYATGYRGQSPDVCVGCDQPLLTVKFDPSDGHIIWGNEHRENYDGERWKPLDMFVDKNGAVYITGSIRITYNHDVGIHVKGEQRNLWITLKYNPDGSLAWIREFDNLELILGWAKTEGVSLTVDSDGNVYVTGQSVWHMDKRLNAITTLKYSSSGQLLWKKNYNTPTIYLTYDPIHWGSAMQIKLNKQGDVFVGGALRTESYTNDLIVLKYDKNGNQIASNGYKSLLSREISMRIDDQFNIYVAISKSGPNGDSYSILLKYNSNCEFLWEKNLGPNYIPFLNLDNQGNLYMATTRGASSDYSFSLFKFDLDGKKLWELSYPVEEGEIADAGGMAVDKVGNVYLAGRFSQLMPAPVNWRSRAMTLKYNTDGVLEWKQFYPPFSPPGTNNGEVNAGVNNNNGEVNDGVNNNPAGDVNMGEALNSIALDDGGNVYVAGRIWGNPITGMDGLLIKYKQTCKLACPADIIVDADPGKCSAKVTYPLRFYIGDCESTHFTFSHDRDTEFPIGTTKVTVTNDDTQASCSFNVIVRGSVSDARIVPVPDKTVNTDPGVCYASIGSVNLVVPVANDDCSLLTVTGKRSDGLALTDNYPRGVTTITWSATGSSGKTTSITQNIKVVDNEPPAILNASVSKTVLWPATGRMEDIVVNYTVTDNCSVTTKISVESNEPEVGHGTGFLKPDFVVQDDHNVKLRAEHNIFGKGRIYTITITATDAEGNTAKEQLTVIVPTIFTMFTLDVKVYPNPTRNYFSLKVLNGNPNQKVTLQVFDLLGRVRETRVFNPSDIVQFGNMYNSGIYYINVIQGNRMRFMMIMKLK